MTSAHGFPGDGLRGPDIAFDREYSLDDLLQLPVMERTATAVCGLFKTGVMIFSKNGELYYQYGAPDRDLTESCRQMLSGEMPIGEGLMAGHPPVCVFPLVHELETVGHIVSWPDLPDGEEAPNLVKAGRMMQFVAGLQMEERQKYLMTANVHGRVVADSYEELQKKMMLLAQSEEKYRLLSEQLEEEVAKKTKQIQMTLARLVQHEKQAAVGQLAGGIAHEINNPLGFVKSNLATIRGYMMALCGFAKAVGGERGALASGELEDIVIYWKEHDVEDVLDDADAVAAETIAGVERIGAIVDRLKIFSAVDHPGVLPTDIRECIDSAISVFEPKRLEKVFIQKDYGDIPLFKCRRDELNQMFMNLFDNSLQAISGNGEIQISVRYVEGSPAAIVVIVSDNGEGIGAEHLDRIFEPFFTTRDVGQGMGLGLYVVYAIVKKLGGDISVRSRPGSGTAVTIQFFT